MINIGRSNVIKENELLEALEKNWIREAVLDVFDEGNKTCIVLTCTFDVIAPNIAC